MRRVISVLALATAGLALQPVPAHATGVLMHLDFDQHQSLAAGGEVIDVSGNSNHGTVRSGFGGAMRESWGTDGSAAARFPAPCDDPSCPNAAIQVPDRDDLDPGRQSFTFGVSLRLKASETSTGSNVLQKGLWGDPGGQWKLQVDGHHGRPSCVISGDLDGKQQRVTVTASSSVSDGSWHRVACQRTSTGVRVIIDGQVSGERAMDPVQLTNDASVLVGAKSYTWQDNDQFHGVLDDVFVRLD